MGGSEEQEKRHDSIQPHLHGRGDARTSLFTPAPHLPFGAGTLPLSRMDHSSEHQWLNDDAGWLRGRHSNSWLWAGPPVPEWRGVQRSQRPGRLRLL